MLKCDRCGDDPGTEGVLTVLLHKTATGIDYVNIRECRPCAVKACKEEEK
jgi:hypothetical protein